MQRNEIYLKLREDFKKIFSSAIDAANPHKAMLHAVYLQDHFLHIVTSKSDHISIPLHDYARITVIGAGKATAPMAEAIEKIIGEKISEGIIIVKDGHTGNLSRIAQQEASHPLPDSRGMNATSKIINLLTRAQENDLIIGLFTGGGSSLLVHPADISLDDKILTTELLLTAGATIDEINCVRKHLSNVKGGLLSKIAHPATVVNLLISDVVGDDPSAIASGPFVADPTTFRDALNVLEKYHLAQKVPQSVISRLTKGAKGFIGETIKPNSQFLARVTTRIISSNIESLEAAKRKAQELGYNAIILSSQIEGDTKEAARFHGRIAREIHCSGNPLSRPACIISGGETTVKVRGNGLGGRNTEFMLYAAKEIAGIPNLLMASVGTDGTDGPTDAAGAIADGFTLEKAHTLGLDIETYCHNNDSYRFFEALGDLVKTGPTKTNVMDFRIILAL
ncbi:MAG: glycerate kinase [Spirochaetes bacterium]|nr:glycerate kinase [Spirochaetota bacterium]